MDLLSKLTRFPDPLPKRNSCGGGVKIPKITMSLKRGCISFNDRAQELLSIIPESKVIFYREQHLSKTGGNELYIKINNHSDEGAIIKRLGKKGAICYHPMLVIDVLEKESRSSQKAIYALEDEPAHSSGIFRVMTCRNLYKRKEV